MATEGHIRLAGGGRVPKFICQLCSLGLVRLLQHPTLLLMFLHVDNYVASFTQCAAFFTWSEI